MSGRARHWLLVSARGEGEEGGNTQREQRPSENTASEEHIEGFAKLLETIGKKLQTKQKGKEMCEKYFGKINALLVLEKNTKNSAKESTEGKEGGDGAECGTARMSSRIRFLLIDLLELRENDWQKRAVKEGETVSVRQTENTATNTAQRGEDGVLRITLSKRST